MKAYNNNNKKPKRIRINIKKKKYNYFNKVKKLENIDNNTSYDSSATESDSFSYKKNEEKSKLLPRQNTMNDKTNNIFPFQPININENNVGRPLYGVNTNPYQNLSNKRNFNEINPLILNNGGVINNINNIEPNLPKYQTLSADQNNNTMKLYNQNFINGNGLTMNNNPAQNQIINQNLIPPNNNIIMPLLGNNANNYNYPNTINEQQRLLNAPFNNNNLLASINNNIAGLPLATNNLQQNNIADLTAPQINQRLKEEMVDEDENIVKMSPQLRATILNNNLNNFIPQNINLVNNINNLPLQPFQNNFQWNQIGRNNMSPFFPIKNLGVLSEPGKTDNGVTKTNQDSYIVKTNINGIPNFNIFGVLDGHGENGHFVSRFTTQILPNYLLNNNEIKGNTNVESIYNILRRNNYQLIKYAFLSIDNNLKTQNFDSKESGTTCVLIIHIGNHLICANVGDSRAIVGIDERNDPNLNFIRVFPLSIDYKPELPEEQSRIIRSGGEVEQLTNEFGMKVGPYRVFARGKDFPGIAMSRSIGDLVAKCYGVVAEPGITEYNINQQTKFIILCSDGVWEFLSNENVRDAGKQFYLHSNATELCQELISRSIIEWQINDTIIDDITAIAIFF